MGVGVGAAHTFDKNGKAGVATYTYSFDPKTGQITKSVEGDFKSTLFKVPTNRGPETGGTMTHGETGGWKLILTTKQNDGKIDIQKIASQNGKVVIIAYKVDDQGKIEMNKGQQVVKNVTTFVPNKPSSPPPVATNPPQK